jgi:WD40 repeat protein
MLQIISWGCTSRSISPNGKTVAVYNSWNWKREFELEMTDIIHDHNNAMDHDSVTISLWDLKRGVPLEDFARHSGLLTAAAFSVDGSLFASGSCTGIIRMWLSDNGTAQHTLNNHTDFVTGVTFSHNGHTLASNSTDKSIKIWDVHQGSLLHTFPVYEVATQLRSSPDDQFLNSEYGSLNVITFTPFVWVNSWEDWISLGGKKCLWIPPYF